MALKLPVNFKNDLESNNLNLVPIVTIGNMAYVGETLSFIPLAICQLVISGSVHGTAGASYSTSVAHGYRSPSNGGYQDSEGFDDGGFYFVTTTSQITIYNYFASTIDVRAALFYTPS